MDKEPTLQEDPKEFWIRLAPALVAMAVTVALALWGGHQASNAANAADDARAAAAENRAVITCIKTSYADLVKSLDASRGVGAKVDKQTQIAYHAQIKFLSSLGDAGQKEQEKAFAQYVHSLDAVADKIDQLQSVRSTHPIPDPQSVLQCEADD